VITLSGSGTLDLTGSDSEGGSGSTLTIGAGTTLDLAGTLANSGATGSSFTHNIALNGDLSYTGTASQTLSGHLALGTSAAIINSGTLSISGNGTGINTSGAGSNYSITNNGSGALTIGDEVTLPGGTITNNSTGTLSLSNGTDTYGSLSVLSGTVIDTANPGTANPATELGSGTITIGSGSHNAILNLDLTGPGGNGPFPGNPYGTIYSNAISVNGMGVNTLEETNYNAEFTGAVTLNSSNLTVIDNNNNGTEMLFTGGITGTGNVVLQVNNTNGNGNLIKIGTGGINNDGTITNSGVAAGGLSTTDNDTQITGVIGSNVTGVIENSAGTALVLSNASNTYTAPTTIIAGSLVATVAGAITSSTEIDVQSGGTLDISQAGTYNQPSTQTTMGAGTINVGTTAFNVAGTIQPHDLVTSIGTLSVNNSGGGALTLQNNSNFVLNIGATTGDQLAANGAISLGVLSSDTVNLTINLTAQPVNSTVYTILTAGSGELTNTGLFSYGGNALANDALFTVVNNGYQEQFEVTYGTTGDELIAEQAIPEPGTWGMALSGAGLLVFAQQMRRRSRK
jgi:autotransporter-associated beta strand protein